MMYFQIKSVRTLKLRIQLIYEFTNISNINMQFMTINELIDQLIHESCLHK